MEYLPDIPVLPKKLFVAFAILAITVRITGTSDFIKLVADLLEGTALFLRETF
jgi:hypothetical protein